MKWCLWLLSFLYACSAEVSEEKVVKVQIYEVKEEDIPAIQEYVGVVQSSHPVEIWSRVEGYLEKVAYVEGSLVKEGDLLFQIDQKKYMAEVEAAKAELAKQEAALWTAAEAVERITTLFKEQAASKKNLDDAISHKLELEARVIAAKANIGKAELELSYSQIKSPITGLSDVSKFREGTLITPSINGFLTSVSVVDPIWVYFSVSYNQMLNNRALIERGLLVFPKHEDFKVSLLLSNGVVYPQSGHVTFTSPLLDPQTGTMRVRAVFANPDLVLRPGQFVRALVEGAIRPHAISVPQKAVLQDEKGPFVFIVNESRQVERREVELGEWESDCWIIRKGLKEGDRVVIEGMAKLMPGMSVEI